MSWWGNGRKYGNHRVTYEGVTYDSKREMRGATWLEDLAQQRVIVDLERQVRYHITVNGVAICDAIVDFRFKHKGQTIWYEIKGYPTEVYRLKKKLILATLPKGQHYLVNASKLDILKIGEIYEGTKDTTK